MNSEYWAEYYKNNIPFTEPSNFARFVLEYFKTNINDYGKLTIQDIGCGDARDTVFFKQNNFNIEGVDPCETIIEKNRILYPEITFNTRTNNSSDIYYLRFVLDTLNIDHIHKLIKSLSLRWGDHYICIETRSTSESPFLETNFNSGIGESHKRTLVSKGYLDDLLTTNHYNIIYSEEVENLNKYKDDNPTVVRIIAKRTKTPIRLSDEEIIGMIRYTSNCVKPRQMRILRLFDTWAKANNLQYFLDYGTLLGAIRDGGMIPYDDDIDVTIDEPRLQELIKNPIIVENKEFTITPSGDGNFYFFRNEEYGKIDLFNFNFRKQLINRPDIIYKKKDITSYRLNKIPHIKYSSEFNLKNIEFEGLSVPIPVNFHELLKLRYGNDYMTTYYASSHHYTEVGYDNTDYYNNNLRKLTREEVYALVEKAKEYIII